MLVEDDLDPAVEDRLRDLIGQDAREAQARRGGRTAPRSGESMSAAI
jgi:hypothetical protein